MPPKSYEDPVDRAKEEPRSPGMNPTLIDSYDQVSPYMAEHREIPNESLQPPSDTRKE